MADENSYGVALFHTNSAVLRAEKILLREGFTIKLIPVPRHLSSDCGIALRFDQSVETRVREILEAANVPLDSIHPMETVD
jgi:hypothetical protein